MPPGLRRFIGFLMLVAGCGLFYVGVQSGSENTILQVVAVMVGLAGLAATLIPKGR